LTRSLITIWLPSKQIPDECRRSHHPPAFQHSFLVGADRASGTLDCFDKQIPSILWRSIKDQSDQIGLSSDPRYVRQIEKSVINPQCCSMLCASHVSKSQTQKRSQSGIQSCVRWHDCLHMYLLKIPVTSNLPFRSWSTATVWFSTTDVEGLCQVVHQKRSLHKILGRLGALINQANVSSPLYHSLYTMVPDSSRRGRLQTRASKVVISTSSSFEVRTKV